MPRRTWTDEDRARVIYGAENGWTHLEVALAIGVSRGAVGQFAAREGIIFPRKSMPPWTPTRRANHRAAMRAFWRRSRRGSLPYAAD